MSRYQVSRRSLLASSAALALIGVSRRHLLAEDPSSSNAGGAPKLEAIVAKGIDYLQTKGQASDGSFSRQIGLGITALATTALLRHGRSPDDPTVARSLKYLLANVQPTGGIHLPSGRLKTYETCVAVLCLEEANRDGRYDEVLKKADKFLKEIPFDAAEGHDRESPQFGGAGYGGPGRPDLSNTAFLVEALRSTGNGADDQTIQNALVFVSRCQNLESPHNTTPLAAKINDGGFYYSPVVGDGQRSDDPSGGLRSYGAMSYSGLKSLVFAGLSQDDPRVKAVVTWIHKHYDLKSNPGMGNAGLYYYYLTFAKGLEALGEEVVVDDQGKEHDWRRDLIAELARRQRDDGAWANENSRWMEGDPNLCTAFALLALSYCLPKKGQERS